MPPASSDQSIDLEDFTDSRPRVAAATIPIGDSACWARTPAALRLPGPHVRGALRCLPPVLPYELPFWAIEMLCSTIVTPTSALISTMDPTYRGFQPVILSTPVRLHSSRQPARHHPTGGLGEQLAGRAETSDSGRKAHLFKRAELRRSQACNTAAPSRRCKDATPATPREPPGSGDPQWHAGREHGAAAGEAARMGLGSVLGWCRGAESNRRPTGYESVALTV